MRRKSTLLVVVDWKKLLEEEEESVLGTVHSGFLNQSSKSHNPLNGL